jgi:hypothetical protein
MHVVTAAGRPRAVRRERRLRLLFLSLVGTALFACASAGSPDQAAPESERLRTRDDSLNAIAAALWSGYNASDTLQILSVSTSRAPLEYLLRSWDVPRREGGISLLHLNPSRVRSSDSVIAFYQVPARICGTDSIPGRIGLLHRVSQQLRVERIYPWTRECPREFNAP